MNTSEAGLGRDEILKWLRSRIKELRNELNFLESIYNFLEGLEKEGLKEVERKVPKTTVRVIASDNNILANIVEGREGLRIILTEGLPKDNSYVKSFLLKVLEDKKNTGSLRNYEIVERRGYVTEIRFPEGVGDKILKELELALKYVWANISEE